jgi:hypothetical protein
MSDVKEISVTSTTEERQRKSRRRTKRDAPAVASVASAAVASAVAPVPAAIPVAPVAPVIVLAPRKPKPAKLVLVPKSKRTHHTTRKALPSSFRATRVRLVIDNSSKTQKRRRQVLGRIDAMTDNQVRAAAIDAQLTARDRVTKVPVGLLRQMLRDFQTMKGALL